MAKIDPALFGYGALFALLAASLFRHVIRIRLGLAVAALLALLASLSGWGGMGHRLLMIAILLVNLALVARERLRDAHIRFSVEERELRERYFAGLGVQAARALIDQGHWISARCGEVLIREDQAAPNLFYLADGHAAIQRDGVDAGALEDGALIGEATVLESDDAAGTVTLTTNARLWFVPAAVLRAYLAANPDVAGKLHEGFARALRGKLASANARIADRPPMA